MKTFITTAILLSLMLPAVSASKYPKGLPKRCYENYDYWVSAGFRYIRYSRSSDELVFWSKVFPNEQVRVGCLWG